MEAIYIDYTYYDTIYLALEAVCQAVLKFWETAELQETGELILLFPTVKQIEELNKHLFLTAKPMLYLVNMSEKDYIKKKNKWWVI